MNTLMSLSTEYSRNRKHRGELPKTTARAHQNHPPLAGIDGIFDITTFLTKRDGTCGAWQCFAVATMNTHNLQVGTANIRVVYPAVHLLYAGQTRGKHHTQEPHERSWRDHAIIVYDGKYYDSSYGDNYGSLNPGKPHDMAELAKKFNQYKVGKVTPPPHSYEWKPGTNATAKWISLNIAYP